jgi:hypothetical protein
MKHQHAKSAHGSTMENHYPRFLLMTVLMFVSMYVLMYAMVDVFANVYNNINQFYMAGLMTAPMVLIEILLMGSMYRNKKLNLTVIAASAIALLSFWFLIREQAAIDDKQFIRSMIPHHSGAILMCQESTITDPELKQLCGEIVRSQDQEIQQLKEILNRIDK